MNTEYDVIIVGGGLVGASLARALADNGVRVAVIEAVPFTAASQPSYDERTLALSFGSRRIFEGLGLWADIAARGATPIRRIHVSDRGHAGITRLDCRDERVEALGYVTPSRVLGGVLGLWLTTAHPCLELVCPAQLQALEFSAELASVTVLRDGAPIRLNARLVVGADGVESAVRDAAHIASVHLDYGQTAVVSNVSTERTHGYTAYERFTDSGPLAVLPASNGVAGEEDRCAVVWTVRTQQAPSVLELDDAGFLSGLQNRFGMRLGAFVRAGRRHSYPLALRQAREHIRPRLALIGNAAHTLHPVAGQGFNLGLRDAAVLAQVVTDAVRAGQDVGALTTLRRYADWRRRDHLRVLAFTDGLTRLFSNGFPPLALARNLGLLGADLLPPVKHLLARQAMGLTGRQPRLARGLPL